MYSLTKWIPFSSMRQKLYWMYYCTDNVISKLDYIANDLGMLYFIVGRNLRDLLCEYDGLIIKIDFFRLVEVWSKNIWLTIHKLSVDYSIFLYEKY